MEEEFESLVLLDEEGKEHEFEILETMELDDSRYAILLPLDDDYEEDEAVIMKLEKDEEGEDVFSDIESDDEWEKVAAAYEAMIDEEDEK